MEDEMLKLESEIQYNPHQPHQASMSIKTSRASSNIRRVESKIQCGQGGDGEFNIESGE